MTTSNAHSPSLPPAHSHTSRRWQPDGDAHLIFRWVMFEGKSQSWVGDAFGVHQSTISRIIQRYERWQAHVKERENGRLDHAERLRAQRWLTFERNELILASCLRMACELEGSIDTSKSTITHHASDPTRELEVRTQHACIDRTGMCSRFLRLAHRINMENFKLAALVEPPAAELAAARQRSREEAHRRAEEKGWGPPAKKPGDRGHETEDSQQEPEASDQVPESSEHELEAPSPKPPPPTWNLEPETLNSAAGPLHNLHHENPPQIAATTSEPCTCTLQARIEKNSPGACITHGDRSSGPDNVATSNTDGHLSAAAAS